MVRCTCYLYAALDSLLSIFQQVFIFCIYNAKYEHLISWKLKYAMPFSFTWISNQYLGSGMKEVEVVEVLVT